MNTETNIIPVKRRPFPSRFVRSYRGFRPFMGRFESARCAWLISTCGTNCDATVIAASAIGWIAGAAAVAGNVLALAGLGLWRGAIAVIRSPSTSFIFCGVDLSTGLDAITRGKPLVGAFWLAGAVLIGCCGYRDARKARAARDAEAHEAGVRVGRDMEAARAGSYIAKIVQPIADATNHHYITKGN